MTINVTSSQQKTGELNLNFWFQRLRKILSSDIGILILLALARILLQVFTNGQYGFHQDELVTLDAAAHHLAWGYVAWPPVTPFLARVALSLFGPSLIGLRSFAVLAEGIVMLLTGLMIRDLGGSRWAQILGAVAVATTPNSIVQGGLFQYETFDYLCWVLLAFTVIRLLKSENPRWWLGIGATIGLGMMTKYTIAFSVAGVIVGILVDPQPALSEQPLAVGRRSAGAGDMAAQPDLASSEPLDFALFPGQHPHSGRAGWPGQQLLDRPDPVQFEPGDVVFGDRRAVLFLLCAGRAALPDDGLDVRRAFHPAHSRPGEWLLSGAGLPDAGGRRRSVVGSNASPAWPAQRGRAPGDGRPGAS